MKKRIKEYYLSFEQRFLVFLISFGVGGYLLFKNINTDDNYIILILSIILLYVPFFDKIKFGNVELSKNVKEIKDQISRISNKIEINNNNNYYQPVKSEYDVELSKITEKIKKMNIK